MVFLFQILTLALALIFLMWSAISFSRLAFRNGFQVFFVTAFGLFLMALSCFFIMVFFFVKEWGEILIPAFFISLSLGAIAIWLPKGFFKGNSKLKERNLTTLDILLWRK